MKIDEHIVSQEIEVPRNAYQQKNKETKVSSLDYVATKINYNQNEVKNDHLSFHIV